MNERYLRAARLAAAVALCMPSAGRAVTLNHDGLGQALIYPYYTAQSSRGNPFNTYLSLVNHDGEAKAVRVRLREARAGKAVFSANVYLGAYDTWTAAVVPAADGARLLTADRSCTEPAFTDPAGLPLVATNYLGDGSGDDFQRMREGFVEIIEMATLTGASAAAVTHNAIGVPANCAAVVGNASPTLAAPRGGLSGTLTLINVASGRDFTVNAEALADLSTRPFFRAATDPYPDFNAAEIDPVSVVASNGAVYRSRWTRPVDAVSAALMRGEWGAEYVLDAATRSLSDLVVTMPTRHFHVTPTGAQPPFTHGSASSSGGCIYRPDDGEDLEMRIFNRSGYSVPAFYVAPTPPYVRMALCGAATAITIRNGTAHMPTVSNISAVFGATQMVSMPVSEDMTAGWAWMRPGTATQRPAITSLPDSTRVAADGSIQAGSHRFTGLPVVGFSARTFENGTLACDAGRCQGNYGGAFPMTYRREITGP